MSSLFNFFKNKKWMVAAIAAIALLSIIGFSSARANSAADVETAEVVALTLAETVDASGSLDAQPFAKLEWKTSGVVEAVNVQPGQKVKKDDVLLTLQPESASASIVSAQADLVSAQKNLEDTINSDSELAQAVIDLRDAQRDFRDKEIYLKYLQTSKDVPQTESRGWYELREAGGWTYTWKTRYFRAAASETMLNEAEQNLELARSKMEDLQLKVDRLKDKDQRILSAQADVDAAQATVNSLSILAPFDGTVLWVEQSAGDVVNAGDLSVNMADTNRLYVEVDVDESDIARVKLGNVAQITLDALPGAEYTGKVTVIDPVGEVISGLVKYAVRVELDKVKDAAFMPLGTTADVTITVKDAAVNLAVPIAVIQNDEQGEYVWVAQENGDAKRVDIVSGAIVGDLVMVTGALQEGDQIQLVARTSGFKAPNPFGGK